MELWYTLGVLVTFVLAGFVAYDFGRHRGHDQGYREGRRDGRNELADEQQQRRALDHAIRPVETADREDALRRVNRPRRGRQS